MLIVTVVPFLIFSAVRFVCETAEIVCVPVRYVPDAMVCCEVVGVMVAAAFVVTFAVKETELFPAVPLETYPAVTDGVTDTVLLKVSVFVPVLTVAAVPLIEAGAVAEPVGIAATVTGPSII